MDDDTPLRLGSLGASRARGTSTSSPSPSPSECDPLAGLSTTFIEPELPLGYKPSNPATSYLSTIIQNWLTEPKASWREIEADKREFMYRQWTKVVHFDDCHEGHMRKAFNAKASSRLANMYLTARRNNKKPNWIRDDMWAGLQQIWNSDEFKAKGARNKQNRASAKGGSIHCGGSISMGTHQMNLSKKLGRPALPYEVFLATHRNSDGKFMDARSEMFDSEIRNYLAVNPPADDTLENQERAQLKAWKVVAGRSKKNRIYAANYLDRGFGQTSTGESSAQSQNEMHDFMARMTREFEELRSQTMNRVDEIQRTVGETSSAVTDMQTIIRQQYEMLREMRSNNNRPQNNDNDGRSM